MFQYNDWKVAEKSDKKAVVGNNRCRLQIICQRKFPRQQKLNISNLYICEDKWVVLLVGPKFSI